MKLSSQSVFEISEQTSVFGAISFTGVLSPLIFDDPGEAEEAMGLANLVIDPVDRRIVGEEV